MPNPISQRFWLFVWRRFERYGWPDLRWAPWIMSRIVGRGQRVRGPTQR